jgi:hypothetical protein
MGWLDRLKATPAAPAGEGVGASPLERRAQKLFPLDDADAAVRKASGALEMFVEDGQALEMRIATEAGILARLDPEDLADRFQSTHLPRLDGYPEEHEARLAWIEDVLRAEHRDVREGRIGLMDALQIAASCRGYAIRGSDAAIALGRGPARSPRDAIEREALQIARLPDGLLRQRFRNVPGAADADIPAIHRQDARTEWIARALEAAETRQLCRLPEATTQGAWNEDLAVTVDDVELQVSQDDRLGFTAELGVSGMRICRVSSSGHGALAMSHWEPGTGPGEIEAIEDYLATRWNADDGAPADLPGLVIDRVSMHVAISGYHAATAHSILFCPDIGAADPYLIEVMIPEGGTRADAIAHVRTLNDEAVMLDEMPEEDAALLWTSLSGV